MRWVGTATRPKVLGCGFHKTATTSLTSALRTLGYRVAPYEPDLVTAYERDDLRPIWRAAKRADAFRDWPWALLYEAFDRRFADARFILTVRDRDAWISSLARHAERVGPTDARRLVYGTTDVAGNEARHLDRYEAHNEAVRAYFADRPDKLLVFDAAAGDGWDELGRFLGVDVPDDRPYPHEYRTAP
jgi:hypothetical protein